MDVTVISVLVATKIAEKLVDNGFIPQNRIVICVSDEKTTASGIIIPESVSDGVAKKGVVVGFGPLSDDNDKLEPILKSHGIGLKVYYGDYAGKELIGLNEEVVKTLPSNSKLRVLSINEIIYLENNNNA